MANRERGEFEITVKGQTYTLVFDINAMVALETLFSTPEKDATFQDVLKSLLKGSVRHIRAVLWAALQRYHGEITLEQAGDLIADAGGIPGVMEQLMQAAGATVPDAADLSALGTKRPPQAQSEPNAARGTGGRSPFRRVRSA